MFILLPHFLKKVSEKCIRVFTENEGRKVAVAFSMQMKGNALICIKSLFYKNGDEKASSVSQ